MLQELRNLAVGTLGQLHVIQQRIVDQLTEVDLHYPDSPLTRSPHGAARHPAGGERAVDVALAGETGRATRLYDALRAGKFAVLGVDAAPPVAAGRAGVARDRRRRPPRASTMTPGHLYLVRPDAYVAFSVDGATATRSSRRCAGSRHDPPALERPEVGSPMHD